MKIIVSAVALVIALGWPVAGEAQSQKAKARSATATHQYYAQRQTDFRVAPTSSGKPCAARTWAGCLGWDPDPNVRMMIQMDAGRDDQ